MLKSLRSQFQTQRNQLNQKLNIIGLQKTQSKQMNIIMRKILRNLKFKKKIPKVQKLSTQRLMNRLSINQTKFHRMMKLLKSQSLQKILMRTNQIRYHKKIQKKSNNHPKTTICPIQHLAVKMIPKTQTKILIVTPLIKKKIKR